MTRLEDARREDCAADAIPDERSEKRHADEPHHLKTEGVVREGLEVDHRIELGEDAPRARGAADDAREDGEEERL